MMNRVGGLSAETSMNCTVPKFNHSPLKRGVGVTNTLETMIRPIY